MFGDKGVMVLGCGPYHIGVYSFRLLTDISSLILKGNAQSFFVRKCFIRN